jgi:hypothetical protein
MLTVFARSYGFQNQYSVAFDGTNDYVILNDFNTGQGNPFAIVPLAGTASKWLVSMWVKMDNPSPFNGIVNLWTQGFLGNLNSNTFRISYIPNNTAGNPSNRIFVDYRNNATNSRIFRQWALHSHTGITGSNSISDLWIGGNGSINTNSNGFVNLCFIVDLPAHPGSLANGNIKCFWNGQELTVVANQTSIGDTLLVDVTDSADILGGSIFTNPISTEFQGKIDELVGMPHAEFAQFRTAKSLSTDGQVASYIWNSGEPGDINSGAWGDFWWRFEQSWTSSGGSSTNTLTPKNGATFSTDHA